MNGGAIARVEAQRPKKMVVVQKCFNSHTFSTVLLSYHCTILILSCILAMRLEAHNY